MATNKNEQAGGQHEQQQQELESSSDDYYADTLVRSLIADMEQPQSQSQSSLFGGMDMNGNETRTTTMTANGRRGEDDLNNKTTNNNNNHYDYYSIDGDDNDSLFHDSTTERAEFQSSKDDIDSILQSFTSTAVTNAEGINTNGLDRNENGHHNHNVSSSSNGFHNKTQQQRRNTNDDNDEIEIQFVPILEEQDHLLSSVNGEHNMNTTNGESSKRTWTEEEDYNVGLSSNPSQQAPRQQRQPFCTNTSCCDYIPCYIIVAILLSFGSMLVHYSNVMLHDGEGGVYPKHPHHHHHPHDPYDYYGFGGSHHNDNNHNDDEYQLPTHPGSISKEEDNNKPTTNHLLQMAPSDLEDWCSGAYDTMEQCMDTCQDASQCCVGTTTNNTTNNNKNEPNNHHKKTCDEYDDQTKHIVCWSYRFCEITIPEFASYVDNNHGEHHTFGGSINTIDIDYVPPDDDDQDENEESTNTSSNNTIDLVYEAPEDDENEDDNDTTSNSTTTTTLIDDSNHAVESSFNDFTLEEIQDTCQFLMFEQDHELEEDCIMLCQIASCCTSSGDDNCFSNNKQACYNFIPCLIVDDSFRVIAQVQLDDSEQTSIVLYDSPPSPLPIEEMEQYCNIDYITSDGGVEGYCEELCIKASCCVHPNSILNCYDDYQETCDLYAPYCSIVFDSFHSILSEPSETSPSETSETSSSTEVTTTISTTTSNSTTLSVVPYPSNELKDVCDPKILAQDEGEQCILACKPGTCCMTFDKNCFATNRQTCIQYIMYCETIVDWNTYNGTTAVLSNSTNTNDDSDANESTTTNSDGEDETDNEDNDANEEHFFIPSALPIGGGAHPSSNEKEESTTTSASFGPSEIPQTNVNYICSKGTLEKDAFPCATICEEALCCFPQETSYEECTSSQALSTYCPYYESCRNLWN